jgi:TRAP-type C4-dicarboxylate transport system permease small subunit
MTTPEKEQPIEERIGNMIGKIFCLFLFAFFIWASTEVATSLALRRMRLAKLPELVRKDCAT